MKSVKVNNDDELNSQRHLNSDDEDDVRDKMNAISDFGGGSEHGYSDDSL